MNLYSIFLFSEIEDIDAIREWEESQYIAGSENKFNEVKEFQVEVYI